MAYKAGSLEIELLGIDTNAVKSIQDTAKALNILSNAFKRIEQTQIVLVGQKLEHIFTKLASATKSIDTTNLTALASAGKSLSAISKIGNLEKVDFTKIGKGFENLSVAITPFLEKVKSAEASLTALYGTLSKANGKKIQELLNPPTEKKIKKGILDTLKWATVLHIGRKVGRVIGNIVQDGADYTETLNLWAVAMGENLNTATTFVNKINEAYGISKKTLMNAQATFKNMLNSLGQISEGMAYTLSEGITQMALDYSSLYNVSIENAMTKFQAVLAGQVRPIRSVSGYDITENTLYELYKSIGGTKTVRQLSRTEKQLLSIYAVFKQMDRSGAVGDMERTIESFANQSRIMTERWKDLRSYVGLVIVDLIETSGLMQGINTILSYLTGFFEAMATYMGAIKTYGQGDPLSGVETGANNALKTINEISGKLLGFDKFRVLGEANGEVEESANVDEKLVGALGEYEGLIEKARQKTANIATEWLKILGIEKDAETGVVNISTRAEGLFNIFGLGSSMIASLGTVLIGKVLIGAINKLGGKLGVTRKLLKSVFNPKTLGIMALVSMFIYLYQSNDEFKKSIDRLLGAVVKLLNTALTPLTRVLALLGKTFELVVKVVAPILTFFVNLVASIIEGIEKLHLLDGALYFILLAITLIIGIGFGAEIIDWVSNFGKLLPKLKKVSTGLLNFAKSTNMVWLGVGVLVAGILSFIASFDDLSTKAKIWIPILAGLAGAITALAAGLFFMKGNWAGAIGLGALVAGAGLLVGTQISAQKYAEGGLPDKGTMFIAGEAGAEMVYNTPSGQSGVANIQQIQQAMYGALVQYGKTQGANGQPLVVYLDGEKVYQNTTAHAKRRGNVWGKA